MSYGEDLYEEIESDGFQWKDFYTAGKGNWKEYIVAGLEGAVTGGAWGAGLGFESLKNYAVGGIVGNLGLAPKEHFSFKNFAKRTVVKSIFLTPMELLRTLRNKEY